MENEAEEGSSVDSVLRLKNRSAPAGFLPVSRSILLVYMDFSQIFRLRRALARYFVAVRPTPDRASRALSAGLSPQTPSEHGRGPAGRRTSMAV